MAKKKVDKQVVADLNSQIKSKQIAAIELIRKDGFTGYLPFLARLYLECDDTELRDKISAVFQDLKDTDGAPVIISLLNETSSADLRSMLLTACWSSSLDFSPYLLDLVEVAVEHEFMAVFEVITVVENFENLPPTDQIEKSVSRLNAYTAQKPEKDELIYELRKILESFRS